jgi:hypothetical protein
VPHTDLDEAATAMIALAAVIAFLMTSNIAAAQGLPATGWISNCIANMETPNANQAYALSGKPPPTHDENRAWCIEQWNKLHPDQRVR